MRFKSVNEMITAIGIRDFRIKWIFSRKEICIEDYQDLFRIYLDEYPQQKELRKEWFSIFLSYKFNTTVDYIKWAFKNPIKEWVDRLWEERLSEQDKKDIYFERRWLRRN